MTSPTATAAKGRARLAEWKALHVGTPSGSRFCWCGLVWPCPTALLIAAVDGMTRHMEDSHGGSCLALDAIFAKLAGSSE